MRLPTVAVNLLAHVNLYTLTYYDPNLAPIWRPHAGEYLPSPGNYTFFWHTNGNYTGNMTLSLWEGDDINHLWPASDLIPDVPISSGYYRFGVTASGVAPTRTFRLKTVPDSNVTVYNYSPPFHIGNCTDEN
ncbi:unnamed protein product [Clonostachys rosea]|uniref:Yeast cell wall synthesis Kre9/Knh1-like N-terminal domain-containing protein n=1 Tax=Bionectria ochroleuca TaxID=29856 RepID=A0ABY6U1Y7_BIOOC|nr:unnamed protein product [Clonostachys rosea]